MTWWGMLQRQRSVLQDRQEYTEQTLTIPLPTNTADPEQAILTTFFYMLMNQQRSQAFPSQESPLHITQRLLIDWIQMAGDYHRLASQQTGYPRTLTSKIATVILDLINANVPEYQRHLTPGHPNIFLNAITHGLQFVDT